MQPYKHLLAAVELDESGERLLLRAQALAQQFGARLTLLHAVEYVTVDTGEALMATPVDLTAQMRDTARVRLQQMCARVGVPAADANIVSGPVTLALESSVRELGADLIVVGHPRRKGFWSALFNHTETDVVGHAVCDVLVLKL